ncbi:MAG: hypothetical protein WC637_00230 [Victivallales bacterium]
MPEIITGKENVLEYFREHFKVHSWQTVKRWKKKGMPIRYLESHAPFIIPKEIVLWAVNFDELTKRDQKKVTT